MKKYLILTIFEAYLSFDKVFKFHLFKKMILVVDV